MTKSDPDEFRSEFFENFQQELRHDKLPFDKKNINSFSCQGKSGIVVNKYLDIRYYVAHKSDYLCN